MNRCCLEIVKAKMMNSNYQKNLYRELTGEQFITLDISCHYGKGKGRWILMMNADK